MSKLSDFAALCTSSQSAPFTTLPGASRLEAVKNFYAKNGLELPASITVKTSKKGSYLSKDEKLTIQAAYITALKAGEVSNELEANFNAVSDGDAVATFSKTLPYSEAVKNDGFGPAVVAAKMIDALDVTLNEKFHSVRKFTVPASVDIDSIPAFIVELQKIYDAAHPSAKTVQTQKEKNKK